MADQPGSVLIVCSTNTVRSPMAAALLRHLFGHRIFVDSVGVRCRDGVDVFAVAAMTEIGLDIAGHRPRSFEDLEDTDFDLIITLSPEAQHRAMELTRDTACVVEYWPTLDPTAVTGNREARLDAYRAVRDGLLARIRDRFGGAPPPGG
ncbi:MAG: low molecular weight phosphatase family protein [Alphaproteobacteria bacterium]|nr:low molecular weight phosphatase family protein [Alphaproteobacteria bacterium]